jgi:cytidylate kinase
MRLGWNLYNRAIPQDVASKLSVPLEVALAKDEASDTRIGRLLARFSVQGGLEAAGNAPEEVFIDDESFMRYSEVIIRDLASGPSCVIVGRAAAIVLRTHETALHVRLDGNQDRRVVQAAEALHISIEESTRRLIDTDRARSLYVKHFYGCDWADARLYHLVVDSTVLSLDVCTEILCSAAVDRFSAR